MSTPARACAKRLNRARGIWRTVVRQGWDLVAKKGTIDAIKMRKETREWLAEHTLADVRSIARDLENAGENVSELVDAINELDALVNDSTTRASRGTAKAEA